MLFSRVAVSVLRLCCAPIGGVHRRVVCGGLLALLPSDIRWDDIPSRGQWRECTLWWELFLLPWCLNGEICNERARCEKGRPLSEREQI